MINDCRLPGICNQTGYAPVFCANYCETVCRNGNLVFLLSSVYATVTSVSPGQPASIPMTAGFTGTLFSSALIDRLVGSHRLKNIPARFHIAQASACKYMSKYLLAQIFLKDRVLCVTKGLVACPTGTGG
jgi:hypothetical protein